jgi:hypothetical protein
MTTHKKTRADDLWYIDDPLILAEIAEARNELASLPRWASRLLPPLEPITLRRKTKENV